MLTGTYNINVMCMMMEAMCMYKQERFSVVSTSPDMRMC